MKKVQSRAGVGGGDAGCDEGTPEWGLGRGSDGTWETVQEMVNVGGGGTGGLRGKH